MASRVFPTNENEKITAEPENANTTGSITENAGSDTSVNVPVQNSAKPNEDTTEVQKFIQVEGPVGKVFTDALNVALANESMIGMIRSDAVVREASEEEEATADVGSRIYATNVDKINLDEVIRITEFITKSNNRFSIIAIECADADEVTGNTARHIKLVEDLAKTTNTRVVYSRSAAIREVSGALR